ncbi:Calcium/calmodulin-dependent protein kinase type I, partial [Coemansia sp. RSA 2599]
MTDICYANYSAPSNPTYSSSSMTMQQQQSQIPCKYRAGRELGRGTYAVVKEMEHIETGRWYAGKIISKKLMAGHEASIGNELRILRQLPRQPYATSSASHLLTLVDYFETSHNVYLVTELCTGGELFDRIKSRTVGGETACAQITRQLVEGVRELHMRGIVHRDLKPENCLLRSSNSDDLAIVDFGMARVLGDNRPLTSLCGTPGYMAPEMVLRTGHGRPVDMWAVGVIALFMLTGANPFQGAGQKNVLTRYSLRSLLDHVCRCSSQQMSPMAWDFVESLLRYDPSSRMTAEQAMAHPWLLQSCWYPTPAASPYASPYASPFASPFASPQLFACAAVPAISVSEVNRDSCGRLVRSTAGTMDTTPSHKVRQQQQQQQPGDLLAMYLEAAKATQALDAAMAPAAGGVPACSNWHMPTPPGTPGRGGQAHGAAAIVCPPESSVS